MAFSITISNSSGSSGCWQKVKKKKKKKVKRSKKLIIMSICNKKKVFFYEFLWLKLQLDGNSYKLTSNCQNTTKANKQK